MITRLKIKERISVNLGSNQLAEILDGFIYEAVERIFKYAPDFSLQWTCDILYTVSSTTHKRIFSVEVEKAELEELLCKAITADHLDRITYIRKAALDRVFLVTLMHNFIAIADRFIARDYSDNLSPDEQLSRLQALKVLMMPPWSVEPLRNDIAVYSSLTKTFVTYIAEKYYRLSSQRTTAMVQGSNLQISKSDLFSNNNLAVIRAIYKYSPNKGTLTYFIQMWMRSNNSPRFDHIYGTAYSIPQNRRHALALNQWTEDNVAVTNIAADIAEAEYTPVTITGSVEEASDDLQLCYIAAAMLRHESDVKAYMVHNAIPDYSDRLVDYMPDVHLSIQQRVNMLVDSDMLESRVEESSTLNIWE